ncbi:MAG: arsenate reductase (glutaredoxin) [Cyclobacteriaceae bacterium]
MIKIYHNPRCRKSREALELVKDKVGELEIIEYLKTPPTPEELQKVVGLLGIKPESLVRKNESVYKEKFKGQSHTDSEWIQILVKNPKLIERPIVINGDKARVGRPPENVLEIL